jgi:hypothetical protein
LGHQNHLLGVSDIKAHRFIVLSMMVVLATAARAAGPQLPCDASSSYAYPSAGTPPDIGIWHGSELAHSKWQPPSCTGWPASSRSKLIVTLTGSIHFDGTMEGLFTKIGAVSTLKDIFYWSATDKKWGRLSSDASALNNPNAKDRRGDFTAADFAKGEDLYYWEDSSSTGETVYRLRVFENTPQRMVVSSDNVTPVRKFVFTLFKPGALQSMLFIQHLAPETFGVYIMTRTSEGASALADGHEETYINRANALFRQLAGIKTNQEPPAIR